MTYFTDIRRNSYNNVIEVNNRLFIEGQEYTRNNFAPMALSSGPTNFPPGQAATNGNVGAGQLALSRTYVSGSTGIFPQSGAAGMFESTKISCGQDVSVGFLYSPTQNKYYGVAGVTSGTLASYDVNMRTLSLSAATIHAQAAQVAATNPIAVFCPLSNGRWVYVVTQSALPAGYSAAVTMTINNLSEAGTVGTAVTVNQVVPSLPIIGDNFVITMGVPWSASAINAPTYSTNRATGVTATLAAAWLPLSLGLATNGCFPSNSVAESLSQSYFYLPWMSASALTVYIGTVSGIGVGGTPAITAYNAVGATVTAVGGGAFDVSQVSFPAIPMTTYRQVRAFVTEDGGSRYLNVYVFEPGSTATVNPLYTNLYMWLLDSKNTATFVQKVPLGDGGRVRSVIPMDSTQKRIVVSYDDKIQFWNWTSATNWTLQSTQGLQVQDVGVDGLGRVWATTSNGTYASTDLSAQELHVFENAGVAATLTMSFEDSAYSFTGSTISSNVVLNAYDVTGARVALLVSLERSSTNFSFSGSPTASVTTSTSADTLVPVSIFATGQLVCRAAPAV